MVLEWLFAGQNAARLAQGLWLTAKISLISVALACVLGTLFGLLMRVRHPLVRFVCALYLDCADSGVAVCVVFRAFGLDRHPFERRVGVHLGVCGLGHRRDGRFGARCAGID